ncbi:MAG: carbohydrate ABC transporter permease [Omnitrophica WOR_2 bacterium]
MGSETLSAEGRILHKEKPRGRLRISTQARNRYIAAFLLLLPALGLRLFTSIYPFFRTFYFAFTNYNPAFPPLKFTGFSNFIRMRSDLGIYSSISFTVIFVVISTILQLIFGIMVAQLLNASFRGRGIVRAINLIPWAIPMVVAAMGFRWMFDKDYGIIVDLTMRLTGLHIPWLTTAWGAKAAVILANVWKSTPFLALVFLAALQGLPAELFEAARVDGASAAQTFFRITLPLILAQVVTIGLFMIVWQLAAFDLVYTMTGGGPGFATSVLSYSIYQAAFGGLNFGYASAISLVLFLLVLILGGLGLALFRRVEVGF